jgi:hypothetical protein
MTLPEFKVLRGAEAPPSDSHYVLLVHRISSDRRSLVHDITGQVSASHGDIGWMSGDGAFTGTPGEALRKADRIAADHGAPTVYVRDDT